MVNDKNMEERKVAIKPDLDDPKERYSALVTYYATQYRKYLLDNGYMTIEQLIAFDAETAVNFEKEIGKTIDVPNVDWEKIKNEIYYRLLDFKKQYVDGKIFVDLYAPKKEEREGMLLN